MVLPSKEDVLTVLRNKGKYSGPVELRSDLTQKQRNYLNSLRSRLVEMSNTGVTDKTIRYVHGVPKIVDRNRAYTKN